MRRVAILGSRGMLGSMALRYFSSAPSYEAIPFDNRFSLSSAADYLGALRHLQADVVLNCIGAIPQKNGTSTALYEANAMLPLLMARDLSDTTMLVHPSTDCVFRGDAADGYRSGDIPNANDDYGLSKAIAEFGLLGRRNVFVVRTSIIGPESTRPGYGLMAWFLGQQSGSTVKGYANHYWNGVTTLDWCRFVDSNLLQGRADSGLYQIGQRHPLSKFKVLNLLKQAIEVDVDIVEFNCDRPMNKYLVPDHVRDTLEKQLQDLMLFDRTS